MRSYNNNQGLQNCGQTKQKLWLTNAHCVCSIPLHFCVFYFPADCHLSEEMDLFGKPLAEAPSSNGYGKKLSVYLLILFVGILGPVVGSGETASQGELVRNAVKLSLVKTQNASVFISNLAKRNVGSKREFGPLRDCVDTFGDAVAEISHSLSQLKNLKSGTFRSQMSDVQTWMSAALTDQDTCLDGFKGVNGNGRVKVLVTGRVQSAYKFVRNALAMVNRYADTGPGKLLP